MRRLLPALLLAVMTAATGARASNPGPDLARSLAAAPARATAAELKAAQVSVDAALKLRKARLDAWQKAQKQKDAAAADVAKKKKAGVSGAALEEALKGALSLDEDAAHARSQLLAAEGDVAAKGAALLKLYDTLLVERRRSVEALPAQSSQRAQAVQAYRDLAAQRDAVRGALLPVLDTAVDVTVPASGVDLEARPDDDVETLLEKADLARDLEERYLRQAEAVRRRISELEDEQAVAKDVSGMVGRSQLFDEEDHRLVVLRSETTQTQALARDNNSGGSSRGPQSPTNLFGGGNVDGAPPPGETDGVGDGPGAGNGGVTSPGVGAQVPAMAFGAVAPPVSLRNEQVAAPSTDPAIAGLLSSSSVSVQSLKALEQKLKAQADDAKKKGAKLKAQAQTNR